MNKCTIAVSSITYAMKGSNLLTANGISSHITKLPPAATRRGCAYGIETDCRTIQKALNLLSKNGVSYSEVVRK